MKQRHEIPVIDCDLETDHCDIAKDCYLHYVQWFGEPEDADWNIRLFLDKSTFCNKLGTQHQYFIGINRTHITSRETYTEEIAYAMFRRVIWNHASFHQNTALREAISILASWHVLEIQGHGNYVLTKKEGLFTLPQTLSNTYSILRWQPPIIKRSQRLWHLLRSRSLASPDTYPEGFAAVVHCLALALETLLTWEEICLLFKSPSWNDWLQTLEPTQRNMLRNLLSEQPHEPLTIPEKQKAKWGIALYYLNRQNEAYRYLSEAFHEGLEREKVSKYYSKLSSLRWLPLPQSVSSSSKEGAGREP